MPGGLHESFIQKKNGDPQNSVKYFQKQHRENFKLKKMSGATKSLSNPFKNKTSESQDSFKSSHKQNKISRTKLIF